MKRKRNIIFNKAGGNAGKTAFSYKVSIPSKWIEEMDITEDDREVTIELIDNQIIITKGYEDEEV